MKAALALTLLLAATTNAQTARVPGPGGSPLGARMAFSNLYTASCADAATCAVTATNGIGSGDVVIIVARVLNGVYISGTDVLGTGADAGFRAGPQGNRSFLVGYYILSSNSVASSGTITVNFAGGTSGGARVAIYDYQVIGGTPALDAYVDLSANSGVSSPFAGPSMTLTGSDVVVQAASAFNGSSSTNVTAVDGAWTNTFFSAGGFANQVNIGSFSVPNWTAASPTFKATAAIAIGLNTTACNNFAMFDSSGGTDGANPTSATLAASTFGMTGASNPQIAYGSDPFAWQVTDSTNHLTYSTAAHHALNRTAPRFCAGGATYSDSGNLGLKLDTSGGAVVAQAIWKLPWQVDFVGTGTPNTQATATAWFYTTLTSADTVNMDNFYIAGTGSGGGNYTNVALQAQAGVLRLLLEGATVGSPVTISPSTWYQLCLQWQQNGLNTLQVFDTSGNQVGGTQTLPGHATAYPSYIGIGNTSGSNVTTGRVIYWDKVQFCYIGTCTYPAKE